MLVNDLWRELSRYEQGRITIFSKAYISLTKADFKQFEPHFKAQYALLNPYENYRSAGWYRHIHAVVRANDVQVHIDRYNPNSHFLLNLPHGVVDVIPYLVWCFWYRQKPFDV